MSLTSIILINKKFHTYALTDQKKPRLVCCSIIGVKLTDKTRNTTQRCKTQIADVAIKARLNRMSDTLLAKSITD